MKNINLSMLCDFYEFTMSNGYFLSGQKDKITYFDVFFRKIPDGAGYAIAAGLESIIDYIKNLHFSKEDVKYLESKNLFDKDFLDFLLNFKFTGDIYAVPEGTPIFPGEPILTVRAKAIEAQLIETYILLCINHQSLITTKSARICQASKGRAVMEFGSRRAQGADAAVLGARSAYIGGAVGTACVLSDEIYSIPASGTMAHSWVQMFDTQYEAFYTYCKLYPENPTLLVDTYDTLNMGIPDAIKVFKELGIKNPSIRLDSGDIAYLSKKARKMFDDAGLSNCRIIASNALDEYLIRDLISQGACIDAFGVGERLITAKSDPVFGGVYKLCAVEDENGNIIPKIKISENTAKITNPHFKKVIRYYDKETGKAIADEICLFDEVIDENTDRTLFDENAVWKTKTITNYTARQLLVPIFKNGICVYESPSVKQIRDYCQNQIETLWDEVKRFENPHKYYVDLSKPLYDIKQKLLSEAKAKK